MINETEEDLILKTSAKTLLSHIRTLTKFGSRIPDSEADRYSVRCITEKFKKYGFNLQTIETDLRIFEERESILKVREPENYIVNCRSMLRSGVTPKRGTKGDLTYVGYGLEEDYEGKDVSEKIVMAKLGKIHCVDKVSIATDEEALGVIIFSNNPGKRIVTYGLSRFGEKIPVIGITNEDGMHLLRLLRKSSVKIGLTVDAHSRRGTTKNIIGMLKGSELPDEIIVLNAHRDSVLGSPGANDNASGTAVIMEIARILSKTRPKRTLAFISSAADEGGSLGAQDIVSKNQEFVKKIVAFINIDMVGVGRRLWIVKEGKILFNKTVHTTDWLNSFIHNIAVEDLGYAVDYGVSELGMADEYVYLETGVPAAWLYKPDDDYYHTEDDTFERIDPNSLKAIATIAGISAWRLATAGKIPP